MEIIFQESKWPLCFSSNDRKWFYNKIWKHLLLFFLKSGLQNPFSKIIYNSQLNRLLILITMINEPLNSQGTFRAWGTLKSKTYKSFPKRTSAVIVGKHAWFIYLHKSYWNTCILKQTTKAISFYQALIAFTHNLEINDWI